MVKIPATVEGIPAIQQCISEGININVTLLFAQEMYEKVALAYIAGLKKYVGGRRRSAAMSPAWPASSSAASTAWWMRS